jgi:hypothetical protein
LAVKIEGKTEKGFVKHRKNTYLVLTTKSGFLSDDELVNVALQDHAARLNVKPVTSIAPESIKVEKSEMTPSEKAFMLARKYRFDDPTYTLKRIWQNCRMKEMSAKDVKTVMEIVAQIKVQLQKSS